MYPLTNLARSFRSPGPCLSSPALWHAADDKKRNEHLGEIMELTEQFKFESGTEAGVNWHTGVKFAPGTYRVKNGVKIVWNGKQWINEATGAAADPLL